MVFYAAFNSISVISRRQFTLFMSFPGFTSTRLGSEVSCPKTLPRKNAEKRGSNRDSSHYSCLSRVLRALVLPKDTPTKKRRESSAALLTSNFSFSHNVFYSYICLVRQNVALCGNGLNNLWNPEKCFPLLFNHIPCITVYYRVLRSLEIHLLFNFFQYTKF